jgi:hypothetical protein
MKLSSNKVSQKRKVQALVDSAEFYQNFKEELIPTLLKLFHEIKRKEHCPIHFMKPVLYSSPNWTRTHPKRRTIGQCP